MSRNGDRAETVDQEGLTASGPCSETICSRGNAPTRESWSSYSSLNFSVACGALTPSVSATTINTLSAGRSGPNFSTQSTPSVSTIDTFLDSPSFSIQLEAAAASTDEPKSIPTEEVIDSYKVFFFPGAPRTISEMSVALPEELRVIYGKKEIAVTDTTYRTTFNDIVYSILYHEDVSTSGDEADAYALFECSQGIERCLEGRANVAHWWKLWQTRPKEVVLYLRRKNAVVYKAAYKTTHKRAKKQVVLPRDPKPSAVERWKASEARAVRVEGRAAAKGRLPKETAAVAKTTDEDKGATEAVREIQWLVRKLASQERQAEELARSSAQAQHDLEQWYTQTMGKHRTGKTSTNTEHANEEYCLPGAYYPIHGLDANPQRSDTRTTGDELVVEEEVMTLRDWSEITNTVDKELRRKRDLADALSAQIAAEMTNAKQELLPNEEDDVISADQKRIDAMRAGLENLDAKIAVRDEECRRLEQDLEESDALKAGFEEELRGLESELAATEKELSSVPMHSSPSSLSELSVLASRQGDDGTRKVEGAVRAVGSIENGQKDSGPSATMTQHSTLPESSASVPKANLFSKVNRIRLGRHVTTRSGPAPKMTSTPEHSVPLQTPVGSKSSALTRSARSGQKKRVTFPDIDPPVHLRTPLTSTPLRLATPLEPSGCVSAGADDTDSDTGVGSMNSDEGGVTGAPLSSANVDRSRPKACRTPTTLETLV